MVFKLKKFKLPSINEFIIGLMILQVLIIRWISEDVLDFFNIILVAACIIALCRYRSFINSKCVIVLILFVIYQILNFLTLGGSITFLLRNWFRTFKSLILVIYITNLIKTNPKLISKKLDSWWPWFNLYAIINIPILLQQRTHDFTFTSFGSFMGHISYRNANYYSKDMMSGLFGLYGTPCLGMFITFLLLFNVFKSIECKKGKNKAYKFIHILNLILLGFYLWMATQNDNKGFFIMLLLFVVVLILSLNERRLAAMKNSYAKVRGRISGYLKVILIVTFTLAVAWFCYSTMDTFKDVVDMALQKIKEGITFSQRQSLLSVQGGGERFAMILYALSSVEMALVGAGLGNYVYTAGGLGFTHFGQADIGTFICLGGSIYILLMFTIVNFCFKRNFKNGILPKSLLAVFFLLSCYTHVFMDTSITISIMLAYFVIWKVCCGNLNCDYEDN